MKPFLICALPRSRTAWLANFLTFGEVTCFHELTAASYSFADFKFRLVKSGASYAGNSDSAQVIWIERILSELNEETVPIVIIERNPADVVNSMQACGLGTYAKESVALALPKLNWVKREFNPLVVDFDSLDSKQTIVMLWNHCVSDELPFPHARWQNLRDKQVQVHPQKMYDGVKQKFLKISQLTKEAQCQ